jgi:hypothetical protein
MLAIPYSAAPQAHQLSNVEWSDGSQVRTPATRARDFACILHSDFLTEKSLNPFAASELDVADYERRWHGCDQP